MENTAPEILLDWEDARCRAKRLFSRERIAAAGITAGVFSALFGTVALVEYALYQAIQSGSVSGIGASVFGYF